MKFKIEIGILRKFLEQFIHSTDELKLCIKEDGISYTVVDQPHIMINSSRLKKEAFVYYSHDDKEFGIDISKCIEILKLGKPRECVIVTDDENKLYFDLGIKTECCKINTDGFSDPKVPELEFRNYAIVEKSMIEPTVKYCNKVLDVLVINMNEFGIRIYSKGDVEKLDYPISKSNIVEYYYRESTTSMYSSDYISMILKHLPDKNIKISTVGDNYPIKIEYENSDMEGMTALAPRIDAGDDADIISSMSELKYEDYNPEDDDIW